MCLSRIFLQSHSLNQTQHNSKTHCMTQQLSLFDPSLHYYCHACRKSLQFSVRIIAKITDFNCFLDFCPPCLALENYLNKIEDYFISKKVGPIFTKIKNASAQQLLQSISIVQKEGIEQMFLRSLKQQEDRQLQVYKQLNNCIFAEEKTQLLVDFGQKKIPTGGLEKEKPNPPNRKHLKTLGYCWQREEFNSQPESVFGYLMSCIEEQEEPTEEQIELRNMIYNYYNQEVQIIEEIKDFLIQSPFLLARKSIFDIEQVPRQLTELKNIESEIKELVVAICNMNVEDEHIEENHSSFNKHGQRVKNRHKKHNKQTQIKSFQHKDQRERTRQKKTKKQKKNHTKEQSLNQQKEPKQSMKKDIGVNDTKRKRGRPKGSKSKVKLQRRRVQNRVFQLKMDMNKIIHKREMIHSKELDEQGQNYENRKRRKLNQEIESQNQQIQQSQSNEELRRRRESSEDEQ